MSFDLKNPTVLLGIAGVGLTIVAIFVSRSSSSSSGSSSSGGGVSNADLTSQVNNVNNNAAAVTQSLFAAQTSVQNTATAARVSAAGTSVGAQTGAYETAAAQEASLANTFVSGLVNNLSFKHAFNSPIDVGNFR